MPPVKNNNKAANLRKPEARNANKTRKLDSECEPHAQAEAAFRDSEL